jgi:hypothetical protein
MTGGEGKGISLGGRSLGHDIVTAAIPISQGWAQLRQARTARLGNSNDHFSATRNPNYHLITSLDV